MASAQSYTISAFAGGGLPIDIPAMSAGIGKVEGMAVDAAGNVFFVNPKHNAVLRLDAATHILTLAAGNGTPGFSGDGGPAAGAQLSSPYGVAVDPAGNLYIADYGNNRIRKVSGGVITTIAGNGTPGFSGDNGSALGAQLSAPIAVAVDSGGNLYIADYANHRIRKVSGGLITTVAGGGTKPGDNSPAISARLILPTSVAIDAAGDLYTAEPQNNCVRKVSNGVIHTVAGNDTRGFTGDGGSASTAQLNHPAAVAADSKGNLYLADSHNHRIRKISNGIITTSAGSGAGGVVGGFSGDDGSATAGQLSFPASIAPDSAGNLYIADSANNRIRKVSDGVITTVAGNGEYSFGVDAGPATNAQFRLYQPTYDFPLPSPLVGGLAVDLAGNLYFSDYLNKRVRKVSGGVITTVAGDGASYAGDLGDNGPATSARLIPYALAVDSQGNLYIADDVRIRKVSNGAITTVAGNGTKGFSGDDGPAASAQLNGAFSVAADSAGNLYIADSRNNRIRKVSNGVITTVAGDGVRGFSGDDGPALSAQLNHPWGVAVESAGNLYVLDGWPQPSDRAGVGHTSRVRKVSNGSITTVAGGGTEPARTSLPPSADVQAKMRATVDYVRWLVEYNGPATSAQLLDPQSIAVDAAGNLYIGDSGRIRKVTNGVITAIAGGGVSFRDHGPATSARFRAQGLAVDSSGRIYVLDELNNRIWLLTPTGR